MTVAVEEDAVVTMSSSSGPDEVGATRRIAEVTSELRYDDLPDGVVRAARQAVLDGIGNMLAGSQQPLAEPLLQHVSAWAPGGNTIAGHRTTTDPFTAAFVNGIFGHCLDFEVMWIPPTHPTSPVLPAILALAERRPGITGRDLVAALVAGFEIQSHLSDRIVATGREWPHGYHPPGIVGPFGSAIATGKLVGLDVDQMEQAIGIAASRIGSLMANTGTMTKASHCGHAARMGLESALLASQGYTSQPGIFEVRNGVSDGFFDDRLDVAPIGERFGRPFRMLEPGLALKKYPSQYPTHWSIEAALDIHGRTGFDPALIDRVDVELGADNESAVLMRPTTGLAGKFSIVFTVAAALLDGRVTIDTFTDERLVAQDLQAMMPRIDLILNPQIEAMDFATATATVTVHLRDGTTFQAHVDRPLGIWDNPMPWSGWVEKFRDCAARAVGPDAVDRLVVLVEQLEDLDDIAVLAEAMAPTGTTET
jgi:aconitate decarboxylase